jgi:hypothetical protein
MKKKTTTTKATAKVTPKKANAELAKLTRPELHLRRLANVAERKRLSEENKLLVELWKKLGNKK